MMQSYFNTIEKFIIVGDRVLLKPRDMETTTESGLFLPPGVHKKDKVYSGYVVKTGPDMQYPEILQPMNPGNLAKNKCVIFLFNAKKVTWQFTLEIMLTK